MKFKFDLKSINLEDASTWLGAVMLGVVVYGIFLGATKLTSTQDHSEEDVDLKHLESSEMYTKVPTNAKPSFVMSASDTPVELKDANPKSPDTPKSVAENPYAEWSYGGDAGPANWSKLDTSFSLCAAGKQQSPINLNNSVANQELSSFNFLDGIYDGEVHSDGRNVVFYPNKREASLVAFNTSYRLKQIDFHVPSEHRINNQKFDLEAELMFVSEFGETLMVAVFAKEAHKSSAALQPIWNKIPVKKEIPGDVEQFSLNAFLPKQRDYFYYDGSLTVPPCQEKVKWAILKEPVVVSSQQIDQFLRVAKFNARPLQKLSGRTVYRSW